MATKKQPYMATRHTGEIEELAVKTFKHDCQVITYQISDHALLCEIRGEKTNVAEVLNCMESWKSKMYTDQ